MRTAQKATKNQIIDQLVANFESVHDSTTLNRAASLFKEKGACRQAKRLATTALHIAVEAYGNEPSGPRVPALYRAASAAEAVLLMVTNGPHAEITAAVAAAGINQETPHARPRVNGRAALYPR
jgi:hypothetical protein